MGTILPKSVYNSQPTTEDELNKKIWLQKIVNGLSDFANDDVARMTPYRVNQYQRERDAFNQNQLQQQRYAQDFQFRKQQYADALKQQQFRNKLAEQEYQLRLAQAMGRGQQMDSLSPATLVGTSMPRTGQLNSPALPSTPGNNPAFIGPSQPAGANSPSTLSPRMITPDSLNGTARTLYSKLYAVQPALSSDIIRAANHQVPLGDILKNWKNPADKAAISQMLYQINPNYNDSIAQNVKQFNQDLRNPKSPVNVNFRSDLELQDLINQQRGNVDKLPNGVAPFLTKWLDWVERKRGSQPLANYDQLNDAIFKEIERGRLQGRPTVSSLKTLAPLYDASLGPDILRKSYNTLLDGVDKRLYNQIYNASHRTGGYGGYTVDQLTPSVIKRLIQKKYIHVDLNGRIVPAIDPFNLSK